MSNESCKWWNDYEGDEMYQMDCRRLYTFSLEGGLNGGGFVFCPFCGRRIEALPLVAEEE